MGRSAAVLACMLMIFPPFQQRVPSHPQGYWLAEPVAQTSVCAIFWCNPSRTFSQSSLRPLRRTLLRTDGRRHTIRIRRVIRRRIPVPIRHTRKRRMHHVIRKKVLPIHRHHHDLQLVRKPLRNNFLNQHRILLQHAGFEFHTLSIGGGSYANTIRLRFRQVFLPLDFGLVAMIFACAAASASCSVDSLRASASSLVCSICFC